MGVFIDGVDIGFIVAIGIDFVLAYGLNKMYQHALRAALNIDNVKQYTIDKKLHQKLEESPTRSIPYGCVEGVVRPVGATLQSHYKQGTEGVMQHSSMVEHKSRRVQGFWSDIKNVIRDNLEVFPFYLVPHGESPYPTKVMVMEPNSAYNIEQELLVTHENFIQPETDIIKKGMELISGEVHKGLQETEKMLIVGTQLMAIGRLVKEGDEIKMKPPSDDYKYIISRKTKDELVRLLQNRARIYKVVARVLGVAGLTLVCFLVYRVYRKARKIKEIERMKKQIQQQRDREEQRRARTAYRSDSNRTSVISEESQDWDNKQCVVCLNNQREVVLLNCGHVCVCGDCAFALPEPRKCPVCRERVEKFVTTYTP